MALTAEGAELMLAITAGISSDSLAGGAIVVSDGTARSQRPLDSADVRFGPQGGQLTLTATFGEQDANFEWGTTEIVSAQGVVIDREVKDFGRKAEGAVWTHVAVLELMTN